MSAYVCHWCGDTFDSDEPTYCLDEEQVQVITCDQCEHDAHPTPPRDVWETR